MKTSFINKILNSQPILIRFALKLFVCKWLSFQAHLLLDLHFPLTKWKKLPTISSINQLSMSYFNEAPLLGSLV